MGPQAPGRAASRGFLCLSALVRQSTFVSLNLINKPLDPVVFLIILINQKSDFTLLLLQLSLKHFNPLVTVALLKVHFLDFGCAAIHQRRAAVHSLAHQLHID